MTTTIPRYMAVQGAALLIACVFLTVGLLGFIPGVTTDYGLLQWAGHQQGAKLFGVFTVSGVHNVVHLAFGAVGLTLTRSYAAARAYLLGGGLAYLGLWAAGFFIDHSTANFGPVNGADHWLHFGPGGVMVLLGPPLAGQPGPTNRPRNMSSAKSAAALR